MISFTANEATHLVPEQDTRVGECSRQLRSVHERGREVAEAVHEEERVGRNVSRPLRRIRLHVALVVLHRHPQDAFSEGRVCEKSHRRGD